MKWKPIDTAPRGIDNEFIGWDGYNFSVTWEGWADYDGSPIYVRNDSVSWEPTHWMPLPPPPPLTNPIK